MTSLARTLPELPQEILEQIVALHGEVEDEEWRRNFEAPTASNRNHSKALLACHMVSKRFRECALRVICRKTFIDLYDTPERLKRLQVVLSGETHSLSQLVSPVRFIREIAIFLTNYRYTREDVYVPKEVVVPVLKTIADTVPMEALSIFGNTKPGTKVYWPKFGSEILQALEAIIQLPSVVDLFIRGVGNLPNQLAATNTHLHTLSIVYSDFAERDNVGGSPPPWFAATLPKLENLSIIVCKRFPEGLRLPSARKIYAEFDRLRGGRAIWEVIQRSSQTLTSITIHAHEGMVGHYSNDAKFPEQLDLSSFPQLDTFNYLYFCSFNDKIFQTLGEVASFFSVNRPAPNLRVVLLDLYLQGREGFNDEYLSRLGNNHAWGALDKALASDHFSKIESVFIGIDVSFSGDLDGIANSDDAAELLHSDIMDSFSRSKMLAIAIEVGVDVICF